MTSARFLAETQQRSLRTFVLQGTLLPFLVGFLSLVLALSLGDKWFCRRDATKPWFRFQTHDASCQQCSNQKVLHSSPRLSRKEERLYQSSRLGLQSCACLHDRIEKYP